MEKASGFNRIERSDKKMYGVRGLLVCGYPEEERNTFLDFISKLNMEDVPVIFTVNSDLERGVGELLTLKHKEGITSPSDLPRSIIMSGLSQDELHGLMDAYRGAGFVSQIWATLTPANESWSLKTLLVELLTEARAMQKKQ
ncbi:MAG: DUF3783 domain-containing protein [Desulfatiglans sp.]|jgi:hypothetical protein|nr:DUF3783 domain-containing protein [Desulfatiglans sp.]